MREDRVLYERKVFRPRRLRNFGSLHRHLGRRIPRVSKVGVDPFAVPPVEVPALFEQAGERVRAEVRRARQEPAVRQEHRGGGPPSLVVPVVDVRPRSVSTRMAMYRRSAFRTTRAIGEEVRSSTWHQCTRWRRCRGRSVPLGPRPCQRPRLPITPANTRRFHHVAPPPPLLCMMNGSNTKFRVKSPPPYARCDAGVTQRGVHEAAQQRAARQAVYGAKRWKRPFTTRRSTTRRRGTRRRVRREIRRRKGRRPAGWRRPSSG